MREWKTERKRMNENQWSSYLKQENKLNVHVLFFSCPIPPPPSEVRPVQSEVLPLQVVK